MMRNCKTPKIKGEKLLDIGLGNDVLTMTPKAQVKSKNRQVGLQTKSLLQRKQNNEKAYEKGENICKPSI